MSFAYGRNNLARALLEKTEFDEMFSAMDKSQWYRIESEKIRNHELCEKFVQLNFDVETSTFLDYCREVTNSVCLQLFYNLASAVLKIFLNKTCVNGLLNRGLMFLFSTEHLYQLLSSPTMTEQFQFQNSTNITRVALDLGAGDGSITEKFFHIYPIIYATETSTMMKRRLTERNMKVLPTLDEWQTSSYIFDTIFVLNLIDRHPKPLTLLKSLYRKLESKETSTVVLAVVFPWSQYVEYPEQRSDGTKPIEFINLDGKTFEEQVESFVTNILNPIGFKLFRWSRLPYLCEGDLTRTCYWLDDAIFVLKA